MPDSQTVTELFPQHRQLALRGLYLEQELQALAERIPHALMLTTFLTDRNGVIATADQSRHFHVPPETRNASDWRLSQELMAQADVIIAGGSYLRHEASPQGHPQDILFQFEPGGEFEDLGEWRLRSGYEKRSPDLAVVSRHLDFRLPNHLQDGGRKIAILTTDGMASSSEARSFTAAGVPVVGGGKLGVDGRAITDYLRETMGARVLVMASGPHVLEVLLQAGTVDLIYITQVQREIPFHDPSTVITLLPNGKRIAELPGFSLSQQHSQDHAVAGDGSPISQLFLRYDRIGISESSRTESA